MLILLKQCKQSYVLCIFPHGGNICTHYLHFAVEFPLVAKLKRKKCLVQYFSIYKSNYSEWKHLIRLVDRILIVPHFSLGNKHHKVFRRLCPNWPKLYFHWFFFYELSCLHVNRRWHVYCPFHRALNGKSVPCHSQRGAALPVFCVMFPHAASLTAH